MSEQTNLSAGEVESIIDQIYELMHQCIKLVPRAGKYDVIIQAVVADLLRAYYDILLAYMYIRKER